MLTRDQCAAMDEADPLAPLRERFSLPDGVVYLDGNSLGAQMGGVPRASEAILTEWREELIGGWFDSGWWEFGRVPL